MKSSLKESKIIGKFFSLSWLIIFLVIWQIAALKYNNSIILPSFIETVESIQKIFLRGEFFEETGITVLRGGTGLLLSFFFGIVLGTLMGLNKWLYKRLMPLITFLQAAPIISWLLLLLIWTENRNVPLIIVVISVTPIFIINVIEGIKETDIKLLEMAKLYKIPLLKIIGEIYIPSVAGYIVSALKNALGITFRVAVMAEVLVHPGNGIGEKMNTARLNVETSDLVAWTIIIIIVTFLFEKAIMILFSNFDKFNKK